MQVTSRRRIFWAILVVLLGLGWLSYWSIPPSMQLTSLAALGILLTVNIGSVVAILYSRPKAKPDLPKISIARRNDEAMAAIVGAVGIMALAIVYPYRSLGLSPTYLVVISVILTSASVIQMVRKSNRRVPVSAEAK